jgi:hypothetical protein
MTDRELLELAAKAVFFEFGSQMLESGWNPLEDDGDALRLAVKLRLGISLPVHKTIRADVVCFTDSTINVREFGDDPYAATRRVIVRAAAAMAKEEGK